jgi:vitamin B12 transporter
VFPSVPAAAQSNSETRQLYTRGTVHQTLFDGFFDHTIGLGYTDDRGRDIAPGTAPTYNRGDRVKLDWQGNVRVAECQTLTVGAEHQLDEIRDSPISAQTTNDAGFVQLQSSFAERLFNTVSLRYDGNDRFGGKTTYRVAPALLFPETGTKFKGTVGTGFKAPTLNQLYVSFPAFNFFANPNLKPETSLGYDLGFDQTVPGQPVKFGATYFHNDINNLIAANSTFTTNININRATTRGVEAFAEVKPLDPLTLRAEYTYTLAMDDILHQQLLRRPKNKASMDARWRVTEQASISATVLYVGSWADVNRAGTVSGLRTTPYAIANLAGTVSGLRTTPYAIANLAGSYDLGNGLTAFARIDNLFDRRYQDPTGFLRPGLSAFGGIKLALNGLAMP